MTIDYIINPLLMRGIIKEVDENTITVHLNGRLGVIKIPVEYILNKDVQLKIGDDMQFYFSYIQVNESPYEYDSTSLKKDMEFEPCFIGGSIIEVNDTAIKVKIMDDLGTIAVPRRWAFTDTPLQEGQNVEFYFSPMRIVRTKEITAECI